MIELARKAGIPCFYAWLLFLIACSAPKAAGDGKARPETVHVTYHVKPGEETEFQSALAAAWKIYRQENLVFEEPHLIAAGEEAGGNYFIEIFTWVNHAAPNHVPDSVKKIWEQMHELCEARNGHGGLEGGEVELVNEGRK